MATGRALVKRALDQLKPTVTAEDARAFVETTPDDIRRAAREIEKEQGSRLELRFMRRIEPFLLSLESYAPVVEVFCQGYSPMAFIWGPIKLMILLARNYTSVMENILQAFSDIAEVLPRMQKLKSAFSDDIDFSEAIGLIYSDILEFFQRAYKFFRCKGWHFWFAFNWGLFERRFKAILHRLSSHCDLVDKEAAAIHFLEMKRFRDARQLEEEAFEQHRQAQMTESVFRWLSAAEDNQEECLHRIADIRQPETCNWILEDVQVRPWIEDEGGDPILWMTGIPGSGKSFLCSLIVEHLQTRVDRSSLYYFCGRKTAGGDTRAIILRTIAVQLLQQNPGMIPLVHQAYCQRLSNRSGPAMESMIKDVLPTVKVSRIVIDGIDECEHGMQKEVLKSLVKIQKLANCNCKLLVSSREEPQIQQALLAKNHMRLGMKTSDALAIYIKEKVNEMQAYFPDMERALLDLVEQRLKSKAQGMFLWVRLIVAMLTQQLSEVDVETTIDQLPDGLDEAYGMILSRFKSATSIAMDRVCKVLYWVCLAYRPIKIHEVVDGIVLRPGQTILHKKTRSSNPKRDVLDLCAPLLEISSSGILSLVHFSAKEYLVDKQSGPFIDTTQAHLSISQSCIINLTSCLDLLPGYRANVTDTELETRVVQGSYGLHAYGEEFWAEHVLAYLNRAKPLCGSDATLIQSLQDLSAVYKHRPERTGLSATILCEENIVPGMSHLKQFSTIFNFIAGWLQFKSSLREAQRTFDTLDVQQQWELQKDVTHLTIIALRLSQITEHLLAMNTSALPPHIDKTEFIAFTSRFELSCRYLDCHNTYRSVTDRDAHEATHVPSFPCLQCDFAVRGFRSRKDLEKHVQRYHMCPEDFEIPASLQAAIDCSTGSEKPPIHSTARASSCWNDEGRKALQRGFSQVLAKIESAQASRGEVGNELVSNGGLGSVREKLETRQYNNLADFKTDVRLLSVQTPGDVWTGDEDIGSFCDTEFEKAVSAYPGFATLDCSAYKSDMIKSLSADIDEPGKQVELMGGGGVDGTLLENQVAAGRRPYWSLIEEKQFPELLQKCGRNFLEIAEYLKTKTGDEVSQHLEDLLRSGRADLSATADWADSRLQQEVEATRTISEDTADDIREDATNGTIGGDIDAGLPELSQSSESLSPYIPQLEDLAGHGIKHDQGNTLKRTRTALEADEPLNESARAKRKPRRRALCVFCSMELHDEYAVKKHVLRFHTATRKVWVCEDVSIDKGFLNKCKSCRASKRYSSRSIASKHLRQVHFETDTPVETLHRWLRETEEPNPNFQNWASQSAPAMIPPAKLQKTGKTPFSLAPVQTDRVTSHNLPSINLQEHDRISTVGTAPDSDERRDSGSGEIEADEEVPRSQKPVSKPFNADLLPNVSFDNVLPGLPIPSPVDVDGPPHRTNKALIKPGQVPRLPHLIPSRKLACQDQVTALYQKLDREMVGSPRYEAALSSLISLSKMLMNDLRGWRKHGTFAPDLPFTI